MNKRLGSLGSLGLGALIMYVFDPQAGRRRRALVRDKILRGKNKTMDAIDVIARDFKNRIIGLASETRRLIHAEEVTDEVLTERIRSKLGGLVSHPSSVQVKVENRTAILSGPILTAEAEHLINHIASMRHVASVENRLEMHESAESIPGLQGKAGVRASGEVNWSPTTRFIAGTFAATLALYGAKKLNLFGTAVATVGAGVLARALSNKRLRGTVRPQEVRTRGSFSGDNSVSEELVDKTLADSFPSSDPPSWTTGRESSDR
jgi:hypothetical protein